jgi:triacylglycerol lipase
MGKLLEMSLAVLNGAVGDYLARTDNGLATELGCFLGEKPVALDSASIATAYPQATGRVALLVPGLMCTEHIWAFPDGSDYGSLLARDAGVTPFYVRYNTGAPIADNGAALSAMLAALVAAYPAPIDELILIGYSMGGLVVRSACHAASLEGREWLPLVRRALYVGTPHRGAPLERLGRAFTDLMSTIDDPYTRLIAQLGDMRSSGIKDLGDADLRHEDRDRKVTTISLRDPMHPVPLLPSIRHYLVAGSLSMEPRLASLFGDTLVPVPSGTDGVCHDAATLAFPPSHIRLLNGVSHVPLAHHPDVYTQLLAWCQEPA